MQLSDIVGKNILFDGNAVGVMEGVCWQKGEPCQIVLEGKAFGASKVKGKKELIVEGWITQPSLPKLDVGKVVYNTNGKLLGNITNVEIGKTLKLKSITLTNGQRILTSQIVANNDVVMVKVSKPQRAKSATNLKPKGNKQITENVNQLTLSEQTLPPLYTRRKSGDFSFLVGKVVDKNIFNFWGELMIRKGDVVTRENYLKARYFGKLTELCLHTK